MAWEVESRAGWSPTGCQADRAPSSLNGKGAIRLPFLPETLSFAPPPPESRTKPKGGQVAHPARSLHEDCAQSHACDMRTPWAGYGCPQGG
jgi:hypothetical protein